MEDKTLDELQKELSIAKQNYDGLRQRYDAVCEQNTKLSVENTQLKLEKDRLWRLVENLSQALNK